MQYVHVDHCTPNDDEAALISPQSFEVIMSLCICIHVIIMYLTYTMFTTIWAVNNEFAIQIS